MNIHEYLEYLEYFFDTLADAKGAIFEADERLLRGVRGAGGIFGVIVELTIKVYPLKAVSI
jgi:hypothetical protein